MKRVIALVEGETEAEFINNVLYQHLILSYNIWMAPRIIVTGKSSRIDPITRKRTSYLHKGGLLNYQQARTQIIKQCKADASIFVTTANYFYFP